MTQQAQHTPGTSGRPGQMTAVMRAVAPTGPKVLRIGLVQSGRVIEERIIKQRTHVTIGPSEKSMFVIRANNVPANFRLFELVNNEYYLNFLDFMTGRLALPTGISDLAVSRGQARRTPQGAYQIKLTEDCRGKVVVGDVTFLFQFVAPPPVQPRPQLPVSVTRGASSIDWATTMIAAISFLVHFMAIGAIYSDWLDPVVDYELNVKNLIESVKSLPPPPPVEEQKPDEEAPKEVVKEDTPKPDVATKPADPGPAGEKPKMSESQAAALSNELESMEMATLGSLSAMGPATAGVLRNGEVPTSALDAAAASNAGVSAGGPGGLKIGGAGGAIRPGEAGGGLAAIGSTGKTGGDGSGTAAEVKGPTGNASVGGANPLVGKVGDASRVVAGMRGGFRSCYTHALSSNPDAQGKIDLKITVGPNGEVSNVGGTSSGNLPPDVLECVKTRARAGRFSPPEGGGPAVIQVPVTFVKQ